MHTKQLFLFGIFGIGALVILGLVWAILAGPSLPSDSRGTPETGLKFNDVNAPVWGQAASQAVVHIYGDFQCPACAVAEQGLSYARKAYQDKVRFVWKDFPLISVHANALAAANAARCAAEQGKFWEYHDALYAQQSAWSSAPNPTQTFVAYAQTVGLRLDAFRVCLTEKRQEQKIVADLAEGRENNVQATPTFFIGHKRVTGVLQNAEWDRELRVLVK